MGTKKDFKIQIILVFERIGVGKVDDKVREEGAALECEGNERKFAQWKGNCLKIVTENKLIENGDGGLV